LVRNYKHEYEAYQGKPDQLKKRAARNKARRQMEREGRVSKGDNKDVDHKVPLKKGGSTSKSNLRVTSTKTNRSWRKGKTGYNI
jgi:5-methylcytosine-specific restriction endonuclease McrA